jgi:hypothetical protein
MQSPVSQVDRIEQHRVRFRLSNACIQIALCLFNFCITVDVSESEFNLAVRLCLEIAIEFELRPYEIGL